MTITQRMYRALLGTQTTQQAAQAAAHVAEKLLREQQVADAYVAEQLLKEQQAANHTITREELNTAMLRAPRGSGAAGVLAQLGIEVAP